jgi:hypothetical protein
MHQTVSHTILCVKLGNNPIQQPRIPAFIPAENSVGNQVGQLQQPRRLRVRKEWNVREVLDRTAEPGTKASVFSQQRLKTVFVTAFIEDYETALRVAS